MNNKELYKELVKIDNLDELKEKVKENGLNIKDEVIEKAYEQFHSPEHLIDEELFNVTGGCGDEQKEPATVHGVWAPICGNTKIERCADCQDFKPREKNSRIGVGVCTKK